MLDEKKIIRLLKESLEGYIKCLEKSDFDFLEFKGKIKAYVNVLNREDLKISFLDISKAKDLLNRI
jgi:hypothetical protein